MRFRPARLLVALVISAPLATLSAQRAGSDLTGEQIFGVLEISEGATVCEIGAGDGSLSLAAARIVGPKGLVYTSELGEGRVKALADRVTASGLTQLKVVSGDPNKTNLPEGACDALFMRNVYHHFADPSAMDASIFASVKPGARVAVGDFRPRGEEAARPADRGSEGANHGVLAESVLRELKAAGFEQVSVSGEPSTGDSDGQHWFIVVVTKPRH
jgi:ubiquinone/menaquinone biosynthesis C-methylase UbiE